MARHGQYLVYMRYMVLSGQYMVLYGQYMALDGQYMGSIWPYMGRWSYVASIWIYVASIWPCMASIWPAYGPGMCKQMSEDCSSSPQATHISDSSDSSASDSELSCSDPPAGGKGNNSPNLLEAHSLHSGSAPWLKHLLHTQALRHITHLKPHVPET